jgi:hypothetical protein
MASIAMDCEMARAVFATLQVINTKGPGKMAKRKAMAKY